MNFRATLRQALPVFIGAILLSAICQGPPPARAHSLSQNEVVDYIKNLRLAEVRSLIERLEAELGVKAAYPGVGPGQSGPAVPAAPVEVQTEFDVILKEVGDKKINVIKVVRELTGLGLKEAKELVESVPKTVLEDVSKDAADRAKAKFVEVGATADIK